MLIAVSSINGSPGVSAWSLMLAAAWPGNQARILVEADLAGGVLAARYGLDSNPGVVSLVSQARLHPGQRPDIQSSGRRLDDHLWCIPGPETAEGAGHIWNSGAGPLAETLKDDDRLWFSDCGRIYPNTALSPLLEASDLHLLFVGSSTESLVAVPSRVSWLSEHAPTCVISVGNSGRQLSEMHSFFGSEQFWQVGQHRDLAKTAGQIFESGRARRSKAWRAAVDLADNIATWLDQRGREDRVVTIGKRSSNSNDPQPISAPRLKDERFNAIRNESPIISLTRSAAPKMPASESRNRQFTPPLPPPNAKNDGNGGPRSPDTSGWYEPLPGIPDNKLGKAVHTDEQKS